MEINATQITQVPDRRTHSQASATLWNKLNVSQKYSARSISNFGYNLTYIRNNNNESLAIFLCGDSIATVNDDGDINSYPDIVLR